MSWKLTNYNYFFLNFNIFSFTGCYLDENSNKRSICDKQKDIKRAALFKIFLKFPLWNFSHLLFSNNRESLSSRQISAYAWRRKEDFW